MSAQRIVILAVLLCCVPVAEAQWGRGDCGPVGPSGFTIRSQSVKPPRSGVGGTEPQPCIASEASQLDREYTWVAHKDGSGYQLLYVGSKQVGGYNPDTGKFSWLVRENPDKWVEGTPPIPVPQDTRAKGEQFYFGLDTQGLQAEKQRRGPAITINGMAITKAEAIDRIEAGDKGLPDFNKCRVTVIGSPAQRKAFTDAAKSLQGRSDCIVDEFALDDWHVEWHLKQAAGLQGFMPGQPLAYVQAPGGRAEICLAPDEIERAVAALGGLREPDPAKPFDPNKARPASVFANDMTTGLVTIACAVLAIFFGFAAYHQSQHQRRQPHELEE